MKPKFLQKVSTYFKKKRGKVGPLPSEDTLNDNGATPPRTLSSATLLLGKFK